MLNNMSPQELSSCFDALNKKISEVTQTVKLGSLETYLTRKEVADLLKCDLSTLYHWTQKGLLKAYGIGNRVYYKLSEIEASLLPIHRLNHKK
ncbi:MAG: helix-turn-helix domain-containing protein [Ferruginibacter sp.]|nr:helix-turn-helix domain-containing protein [Ferruginibacter sp.]